jgi:hypothetical protein
MTTSEDKKCINNVFKDTTKNNTFIAKPLNMYNHIYYLTSKQILYTTYRELDLTIL